MSLTTQTGKLGESIALTKFLSLGYEVFLPFGDGSNIDLVVKINNRYCGVQVKTISKTESDRVICPVTRTINGSKKTYSADEVDYFVFVVLDLNKVLLYKVESNSPTTQINFQLERKNVKNARFIDDFLIENILGFAQ